MSKKNIILYKQFEEKKTFIIKNNEVRERTILDATTIVDTLYWTLAENDLCFMVGENDSMVSIFYGIASCNQIEISHNEFGGVSVVFR